MSKFMPHIRLDDGKCREAMEFYKSIFGGKLEIMTIGDTPKDTLDEMAKGMRGAPMPSKDRVMHASLEGDGFTLLGADAMRDPVKNGDQVSIMVECDSQKDVDDKFAKLGKDGEVFMKPEKMFWGGYFGSLTDKYGVEWSLHFQMEPMKK